MVEHAYHTGVFIAITIVFDYFLTPNLDKNKLCQY